MRYIEKLGEDYPIPRVGRRILICRRCRSRNIDTVPYWNDKKIAGVQETYSYPEWRDEGHDPLENST